MKNLSKGLLMLAVLSVGIASCSDESLWKGSESEGGINLNFSSDSRVMRQTRADDGVSPVVPDGSRYSVGLVKTDGSYSKNWASVDAFNRESSFPIGDYTLSASFGDTEKEGFELPCFKGSTNVHVSPGETAEATVVATLANAMVSVRYTDAFIENFTAYSAAIQTEGHDFVVFAQDETRPAYVSPSKVNLNLTLTNQYGETVTIQPANFTAVARHHYVVTVGVTGNTTSGDLALDVVFDDDVVAETVNVSLGDDLYSAPAPTVTAKGFTPEVQIESVESEDPAENAEFHVFSFGGLKSTTLTVVAANGFTPTFGRSVQLVNADALTQSQLANEGVECSGFFKNVDKMGVVNMTKFLANLPAGEYTIELQAVDALTRTSEPLKLMAKISALNYTIENPEIISVLSDEIKVLITSNSSGIKNKVKFRVPDANNRMVEAQIKSVEEVNSSARELANHAFLYTVVIEPQIRDFIDVEVTVGNRAPETVKVPMAVPEFSVEADAYARKVVLRISSENAEVTSKIIDNIAFKNAGKDVPAINVTHDANGYITISGLTPGVEYTSLKAVLSGEEKSVPVFTTESETNIVNGNLDAFSQTINIEKIATGGKWTGTAIGTTNYQSYSGIVRSTPDNWANINDLTCYTSSANLNTWFLVPSTFSNGGQTVIRSVGYSHNGKTPDLFTQTTVYYNQNAPSYSDLDKASGELFLGEYSYDGSEHRVDGIDWRTRPSSLSFDYTYQPVNNEEGEVYVKLLSESGNVIAENVAFISAATSRSMTVNLPDCPFGVKAAKLILGFKSTKSGVTPSLNIPSGTALNDGYYKWNTFTTANRTTQAPNTYKAEAVGSVLTLDNVSLGYAASGSSSANAKARNNSRIK